MTSDSMNRFEQDHLKRWWEATCYYLFADMESLPGAAAEAKDGWLPPQTDSHGGRKRFIARARGQILRSVRRGEQGDSLRELESAFQQQIAFIARHPDVPRRLLSWLAQDDDGNVWYFGEHTMELAGGLATTLEGTFVAGVDGAKPGIVMEANPAIGDFYRQEFDLANAEDFAEVVSLDATRTVPCGVAQGCAGNGTYDHLLETAESTPLEPDLHEHKFYAAGVGNIATVNVDTGETTALVAIVSE